MGLFGFLKSENPAQQIRNSGFEICSCEKSEGCGKFPSSVKFNDDDNKTLWNTTKPYGLHCIISTGKTDWNHNAIDTKGSLEYEVDQWASSYKYPDGTIKVSVSSLPTDPLDDSASGDILLLPFFVWVRNVSPSHVHEVLNRLVPQLLQERDVALQQSPSEQTKTTQTEPENSVNTNTGLTPPNAPSFVSTDYLNDKSDVHVLTDNSYAFLFLCSHRTRDKRCGITAPIMKKEFEIHLREIDKYRDLGDDRPDGVRIAFINHVGGHKYAANVLIYLKNSGKNIWLARCSPSNVKPIVEQTILEGKVWPEQVRIVQKFKGIEW
jgi:(2Fe-2S) ferredoxin